MLTVDLRAGPGLEPYLPPGASPRVVELDGGVDERERAVRMFVVRLLAVFCLLSFGASFLATFVQTFDTQYSASGVA